jgi:hypothetical protein
LFSYGFCVVDDFGVNLLSLSATAEPPFALSGVAEAKETLAPGSRLCVIKVLLVSTLQAWP